MTILFTVMNISEQHQRNLKNKYPKQSIIFCEDETDKIKHMQNAEVVVTYGSDITGEMVNKAKNLKWIQVLSAGVNGLPVKEINERNILVTNVSGIHKIPMSEYAISMLLHVYRRENWLCENQAKASWDQSKYMKEITGRTMLVLGTGAIGQEVARLAKAFQMKTIGVSRSGQAKEHFDETYKISELDNVLGQADFVIAVLPSTIETQYLLTFEHFQQMKDEAVFLNMGRGDLVRGEHILRAVQENEIAHAILDVFEEEPLPADDPLWKEERVTITPHISGVSPKYHDRALEIFDHNLNTYIEGTENYINKIDMTRGY